MTLLPERLLPRVIERVQPHLGILDIFKRGTAGVVVAPCGRSDVMCVEGVLRRFGLPDLNDPEMTVRRSRRIEDEAGGGSFWVRGCSS